MIIIQLIYNLCLLIAISIIAGFIDQRWKRNTLTGSTLQGLIFGATIIIGMYQPFIFEPGVIFDGRSVILSICAVFFGPLASAVSTILALAYRIYIGGDGVVMGISVIMASTLIGLSFYYLRKKGSIKLTTFKIYILGLLVHIVMIGLMLLLPETIQWSVFKKLSISIIIFYPLATLLIGKILKDQEEKNSLVDNLQHSEKRYRDLIEFAVRGILIGSHEGIIIEANSYFCELIGRKREEFIGKHISEAIFTSESLNKSPLRFDLLNSGKIVINEREILRPDGKIITIEMHTKMMPDGSYQSIFIDITEKKKAQEELRKEEEKFRNLVETSSDLIWETNMDGKFIYISPHIYTLLGYTQEEVLGLSPFDLMQKDEAQKIKFFSDEIIKFEKPYCNLINVNKHKLGHNVVFETSGVPVFDQNGKLKGYRGIDRDITNRKKIEDELKESEEKYKIMIESSNDSIMIIQSGIIKYCNKKTITTSGYSEDEIVGQPFLKFLLPSECDRIKKYYEIRIKGGDAPEKYESKAKLKSGNIIDVEVTPVNINYNNSPAEYVILRDITETKKALQALKESQLMFKTLAEVSPVGIFRTSKDGDTTYVNPAWSLLSGLPANEALGDGWLKAVHPDDRNLVKQNWKSDITKSNSSNAEYRFLKPDGTIVWVLGNAVAERNENDINGYIGTITNITDQKLTEQFIKDKSEEIKIQNEEYKQINEELIKAKRKAEESDRLKTAFLANISHEIRTPMNGILGFSELLKKPGLPIEKQKLFIGAIEKSGHRMLNIINDIIDLSKIEAGQMTLKPEETNINQLIQELYLFFSPEAKNRNLNFNFHTDLPDENCIIITDQHKIAQIITNLVKNALKFTTTGNIDFGYKINNALIEFYVKDTGDGIAPKYKDIIFERFRQGSESLSRNYEGAGLGLSISKALVELLGGNINVTSELGKGSTFYFTIPYSPVENTILYSKQGKHATPVDLNQPINILIVEDDDYSIMFLEEIFRKENATLLFATNGIDAIKMINKHPEIHLVLMDLKMPELNGFEATKEIKKIRPELPIIAQTAFALSIDEENAIKAGCNGFITKPINSEVLLEMIYNQLKK